MWEKEGWVAELREIIQHDGTGVIAVEYQDIHRRTWASYLYLERHVDVDAFVMEGGQNITEISK